MTSLQPQPVAILGGGPVGLTLALLLARQRVRSVVFDARALEQASADRRLLALSSGSLQTLMRLVTLSSEVLAPIHTVIVSSVGEFGRAMIDHCEVNGEPLGATIRYGDLIAALSTAAEANDSISVRRPAKVSRVQQSPASVQVELQDGEQVVALLAASAEGFGVIEASATHSAVVADVGVVGVEHGQAQERFTREGPLALLPLPAAISAAAQTMALVWCMTHEQAERRSALPDSAFIDELNAQLRGRRMKVVTVQARRPYPLNEQVREQLVEHRTVYLGNAAQTLHPVAGQGLNLGLRDSVILANQIGAASAAGTDPVHALQAYAQLRGADRAAIVALTRTAPALFSTRFAPVALARSIGLTALAVVPNLRRDFARLLMFGVRF